MCGKTGGMLLMLVALGGFTSLFFGHAVVLKGRVKSQVRQTDMSLAAGRTLERKLSFDRTVHAA